MKVLQNNESYSLISGDIKIIKDIPVGIYDILQNPMSLQFSLQKRDYDTFTLPNKIYGVSNKIIDKVINKYKIVKDKNLGVLFAGCKGTGKSLAAKKICNEIKLPIIVLKSIPDEGDLIGFLTTIPQPYAIFIDEFEKIVTKEEQVSFLSLLDGSTTSNILFLLTANDDTAILNQYKNRPSRIHYCVKFESLSFEDIKEVLDDNLKRTEKKHITDILKLCSIIGVVNYDIIKSIIEEVNEFGFTSIEDLLLFMNIEPENDTYNFVGDLGNNQMVKGYVNTNPLIYKNYISEVIMDKKNNKLLESDGKGNNWFEVDLDPSKYTKVTYLDDGYIIYQNNYKFTFTRIKTKLLVW